MVWCSFDGTTFGLSVQLSVVSGPNITMMSLCSFEDRTPHHVILVMQGITTLSGTYNICTKGVTPRASTRTKCKSVIDHLREIVIYERIQGFVRDLWTGPDNPNWATLWTPDSLHM